MRPHIASLCAVVFCLHIALAPACADWPEFRGPDGNGHVIAADDADASGLPLTWSETKNVRWKTPIPHRGLSTPVVMNGQVWLTTATQDGHEFFAICIDAETGQVLHNKKLFDCAEPEPLGNNVNNYAACSPAIEPGRVYVHFGSYGTACLDTATGDVVWKRDDLPCRHYRGPSSSVVLFENLAILTLDGADLQYLVALDKKTGETVWKTNRDVQWNDEVITGDDAKYAHFAKDGDFRKAHSTPLIVTAADGRPQMLSGGAKAAFSYDPRTGRELWRVHYNDWSVAPRPLYEDGTAYLVTGLMRPELWAIRTDGTGDLTETDNVTWRVKKSVAKTASPILVEGLIYMIGDEGVLTCLDAASGEPAWSKRIGGKFAASPIYAAGTRQQGDGPGAGSRIYFCDKDGETTVIRPGRKYEELAKNTLDEGCMASPAADGAALYLRTETHLYRIEEVN